jgi:hypothetical protein
MCDNCDGTSGGAQLTDITSNFQFLYNRNNNKSTGLQIKKNPVAAKGLQPTSSGTRIEINQLAQLQNILDVKKFFVFSFFYFSSFFVPVYVTGTIF